MKRLIQTLVMGLMMTSMVAVAEAPVEDVMDPNTQATATVPDSSAFATNAPNQAVAEGVGDDASYAQNENQQYISKPHQQQATVAVDTSNMTMDQRVAKLEQQIANLQQMNLTSQISALQQQLQEVQGRLEVTTHQLQVLQSQQRDVYQDLDKRLNKLSTSDNVGKISLKANTKPIATNPGADSVDANADTSQENTIDPSQTSATANTTTNPANAMSGPIGQADNSLKEQDAYENAYDHIKNKQYSQAIDAMQGYLAAYPDGKYAANAQYWLGELYLLNGDSENARKQFVALVDKYPNQPKAADAILKIGYIAFENGDIATAKTNFDKVVKTFPDTPSARLAEQRLQQLQQTANG